MIPIDRQTYRQKADVRKRLLHYGDGQRILCLSRSHWTKSGQIDRRSMPSTCKNRLSFPLECTAFMLNIFFVQNLNVQLETVINDSSATLLAQSYVDSSARISLIVGTGVNSAIHLPTSSLSRSKFGDRARQWFDSAECVIVNTELSLFGKEFLPYTRWDEALNCCHPQPDFQPLEYRVGGLYLGELVRLICVEAIRSAGLFRSCMPERFGDPYSLDTKLLAVIES